ncbi:MAG TPA: prepilin-type N-terminal cleavage/methylation domain-containing protein, partial [Thiotrichales bacterium]|nr:prepilin-type N-terminal cleavage/methylation domain-containing protein [Thiotrichales bacterium]
GFTLVEMAIVLVIIGLLLGGVLKGQELIESSRIKNAANDINGVIAAYNGYVDRFRAVPGDDGDANIALRGTAWTNALASATSDGRLDAVNPFGGAADESTQFWVHVRAAGFISGNSLLTGAAALPTNAFSGLIGVTGALLGATAATQIAAGVPKVCLSGVPGKSARALDVAMDDGVAATGIMRGFDGPAPLNPVGATEDALNYSDNRQYTICRTM